MTLPRMARSLNFCVMVITSSKSFSSSVVGSMVTISVAGSAWHVASTSAFVTAQMRHL